MFMRVILSTVFLVSTTAFAQTKNNALEIQAIQQHFINSRLVPELLSSFNPSAYLTVTWNNTVIAPGTLFTIPEVQTAPGISVTIANASVTIGPTYTLAMVDPMAVGASTDRVVRHWLVNGVQIGNNSELVFPADAKIITAYRGPGTPAADPPHRYTLLLYHQPTTFDPKGDLAKPGQPIAFFNLNEYVTSSGLGPVVAGWYFTCVGGSVRNTITTSAVVTSTLPAYTPSP